MKLFLSRRNFVKNSLIMGTALPAASPLLSFSQKKSTSGKDSVPLGWLGGQVPSMHAGVTWGVPWPKGEFKDTTQFVLNTTDKAATPLQSWPLAYWPDGSLKWTAHAIPPNTSLSEEVKLVPGKAAKVDNSLKVEETASEILVDTGSIQCVFSKGGNSLISTIRKGTKEIVKGGQLVLLIQGENKTAANHTDETRLFNGEIGNITVEQAGAVRAVVKIEGKHVHQDTALLPFVLRFYFYKGGDSIKVMHTIIYDGDENKDFIKGLGLRFSVPMEDELHDRHVRFIGENEGVFGEAVRGLTGLRRDPGRAVRNAQVQGEATPDVATFPTNVSARLKYIPAFGDYTLFQGNSDSFEIRKRTQEGYSWLNSGYGRRSAGLGYVGGPAGGLAFGIRNFWQSYPAQLDIRNAATDTAEITMWLWAPDAPAMDLRFYHDGMGQDTYEKQLEGLEITYEDYEPGFGTPNGVARTSEMLLWVLDKTPPRETLLQIATVLQDSPRLVANASYMKEVGAFGDNWGLPDRSSPMKAKLEDRLDFYFDFYKKQIDQHRWYGFWNYGDVMHSYDHDRHMWKYDIGGFAWDNSELSTDIWLWYYFLRTGRADVFKMAEAMTRHTGEVDVHHIGPFAPLGSRHNVLHWGCSAKQLRISTAANRRYYYYLTGDERTGDLLSEQIDGVESLIRVQPTRKLRGTRASANAETNEAQVSFGTDWGSAAAAWLTDWERTKSNESKNRLLNSMRTIAAQPHGFFSGGSLMKLDTGEFAINQKGGPTASHLSAVFGLAETCGELIQVVDMPEFKAAWLQYCELYNAPDSEQAKALGRSLGKLNLRQGHARLTAYAAHIKNDPALGERAWEEFFSGEGGIRAEPEVKVISGPQVLNPIDEALSVSTNGAAQWGLAVIQCLAFSGNELPK